MFVSMRVGNAITAGITVLFITFLGVCVLFTTKDIITSEQHETRTQYDSAMAENARLKRIISLWPEEPSPKAETVHVAFKPDTIFLKPAQRWAK